jgi:hypothetical protein
MFDQTIFFFKWVLPISTVAFLFGSIWFMLDSKIQLDDLDKRNGQIVNSRFVDDDSDSYVEIFVNNGDLIFLNSNWKSKFVKLKEKPLIGMNIEYFFKSNKKKKIFPYQLHIDNDVVFDLSEKKDIWLGISWFFGCMFILCLIGLLLRICYLESQDGNPTCGLIKSLKFKTRR